MSDLRVWHEVRGNSRCAKEGLHSRAGKGNDRVKELQSNDKRQVKSSRLTREESNKVKLISNHPESPTIPSPS